jgi:phosphatidylglycerol:prolipoprotein diacylglycerol transferase
MRSLEVGGVITIGIDPYIELGPISVAWHGLMTAVGLVLGGWISLRWARRHQLDHDRVLTLVLLMAVAGIAGARLFYLVVNEPESLLSPGEWLGSQGFAFYGGMIFGTLAVAIYLWRNGLGLRYLDALAFGFPLGLAVGRIGDLINGEHYGSVSDAPWAVRNSHPDADVPSNVLAYHSGGLYEITLGLLVFAAIWPLRDRLRPPGALFAAVVALYAAGRFVMFFYRDDSPGAALGLVEAQWTSLGLLAVVAAAILLRRRLAGGRSPRRLRAGAVP